MYEAYSVSEVALKLPLEITSITCQKSSQCVYGGCKDGELFVFSAPRQVASRRNYHLEKVCKHFSRRSVIQMQICERENIMLRVSDGMLAAHNLADPQYSVISILHKVKSIHTFAAFNFKGDDVLYILCSSKRRLFMFKWFASDFQEIHLECEKTFTDTPSNLTFCGSFLTFNTRDEYCIIILKETGVHPSQPICEAWQAKVNTVANFSENPVIVDIRDKGLVGVTRGDALMLFRFINDEIQGEFEVKFSDAPQNIAYDPPYLIALLSKGRIEVRTLNPSILIQNLVVTKAQFITAGNLGQVYVASSNDVWILDVGPNLRNNLNKLIDEKQFEIAIQIVEMSGTFTEENRAEIKRQAAVNFFKLKKFEESFRLHQEIKTDVVKIIKMFPELLPDMPEKSSLVSAIEDLPANDKKRALLALGNYLSVIRSEYSHRLERHRANLTGNVEGGELLSDEEEKNLRIALVFVDTTLLNCYLKTKPILVDSLLRLPSNTCVFEDAEKILRQANRLSSLFILFETRHKHDLALELLYQQSHTQDCDPFFKGTYRTVVYLQTLGNTELPLIFKYARWVLDTDVSEGLQIFIGEDSDFASLLDREKVLEFLKENCVLAVIPYLEHLVYVWEESKPQFHEALMEHYIAKVKHLMQDYIHACRDDENIVRAGEEEGDLGIYRCKLIRFLQFSLFYNAQAVLLQLNNFPFYEERALVLGRLKQHEAALTIYTCILNDFDAAEKYCQLYYDKNDWSNSMVYIQWLRAYLSPSDPLLLAGLTDIDLPTPVPDVKNAIKVLSRHADRIDTVVALSLIPPETPLRVLSAALNAVLQTVRDQGTSWSLRNSVCATALQKASSALHQAEMTRIPVTNASECVKCGKKIGNSAFIRFPSDGSLAHFYCHN